MEKMEKTNLMLNLLTKNILIKIRELLQKFSKRIKIKSQRSRYLMEGQVQMELMLLIHIIHHFQKYTVTIISNKIYKLQIQTEVSRKVVNKSKFNNTLNN